VAGKITYTGAHVNIYIYIYIGLDGKNTLGFWISPVSVVTGCP